MCSSVKVKTLQNFIDKAHKLKAKHKELKDQAAISHKEFEAVKIKVINHF